MSSQPRPDTPSVRILGVDYDNLTRDETLDRLEAFIAGKQPRMVCTPNADHLVLARHDAEFRRILRAADLVVSDGMAVVYGSRLLGRRLKQNVGGRLLLSGMADRSAQSGHRLFLLGGRSPAASEAAIAELRQRYPGTNIVGSYTPPMVETFTAIQMDAMVGAIRAARPDVLFVCLGTPKQEKFIAGNLNRLEVPVSIGVGAALDLLAGRIRIPPAWMTEIGLEWAFRLIQEPSRLWRRYLTRGPYFGYLVLREIITSLPDPENRLSDQ